PGHAWRPRWPSIRSRNTRWQTASARGCFSGTNWRAHRAWRAPRFRERLFPFEDTFSPRVAEADRQNAKARHHGPEDFVRSAAAHRRRVSAAKRNRPGEEDQQFHVEHEELDRQEIKGDVEALTRVVDRVHSRLVRHLLYRGFSPRSNHLRRDQNRD